MSEKSGQQLKLEGITQVIENSPEDWRAHVQNVIAALPGGWEGTGEDIRSACHIQPHHPNAWGGVIHGAVKQGLLVETGEYRKMRRPSSHARRNPVYKKVSDERLQLVLPVLRKSG